MPLSSLAAVYSRGTEEALVFKLLVKANRCSAQHMQHTEPCPQQHTAFTHVGGPSAGVLARRQVGITGRNVEVVQLQVVIHADVLVH